MIFGIGVDICSISRMKRAVECSHFLNRVFHNAEIEHAKHRANAAASYAAAFAAREAFCKAASISMYEVAFSHGIWVERDKNGKPSIALSERINEKLSHEGKLTFHISLSHEGDIATAFVVIEK